MTLQEALEQVLRSYQAYYTVNREDPLPPFAAPAEFGVHGERFFLIKQAKYAEIDSYEHVYFALEEQLTASRAAELAALAWQDGVSRVQLSDSHRETDVLLIVLTRELTDEAARVVKKTAYSKSYRLGLQGYSHFRFVAFEPPQGALSHNRQGEDLAKLMRNIFKS